MQFLRSYEAAAWPAHELASSSPAVLEQTLVVAAGVEPRASFCQHTPGEWSRLTDTT